jgi:hypothetical protein
MAVAVAAGTCWSVQGLGGIQLLGRYLEACLRAEPVPVSVERRTEAMTATKPATRSAAKPQRHHRCAGAGGGPDITTSSPDRG